MHPYMKTLQDTLSVHYQLYECLNKRLALIKNNYSTKTEYEKNEIEITIIKTKSETEALKKLINTREEYFKKFIQKFSLDVDEMEKNYDIVLRSAKDKKDEIPVLRDILHSVNWKAVDENIEVKLKLYERLNKLLK